MIQRQVLKKVVHKIGNVHLIVALSYKYFLLTWTRTRMEHSRTKLLSEEKQD